MLEHIKTLEQEGRQLCEGVSNATLIKNILGEQKYDSPYPLFTWEHCPSSTAQGRKGVMRLVPKSQHQPNTPFWKLLHPEYKNRGGYHQWAVPAGAPVKWEVNGKKVPRINEGEIKNLPLDKLGEYFHRSVKQNDWTSFELLLLRAKKICSTEQLHDLLTKNHQYPNGSKRFETLLHAAAVNGNLRFIQLLLKYDQNGSFLNVLDSRGNTAVHFASLHERDATLKLFRQFGADFSIKNKAKHTAYDWAVKRKLAVSMKYAHPIHVNSTDNIDTSDVLVDNDLEHHKKNNRRINRKSTF